MKIVTVVENETCGRLTPEFGLSLMVETPDNSFLVDTGASSLVLENLFKLGYNVEDIPFVIISHNHRDHIGGLLPFLEKNKTANVFVSENIAGEFVKAYGDNIEILSDNYAYYTMHDRFFEVDDMQMVARNVAVCHVADPDPLYMAKNPFLMQLFDGMQVKDNFRHEVYVAVFDGRSYNIISPCSHNGIINIIADAKARFPRWTLNAYIGGLHIQGSDKVLMSYGINEIIALADQLNETGLKALYTGHCTGKRATEILKSHCNFPVETLSAGAEFEIK